MSPSIETRGPENSGSKGDRTPVPGLPDDPNYSRLEEKLTSLAASVSHWQRDLENSSSRSSRLEGAFTVLMSSLEGWKSDIREVASRTESRVLRGLEVIDSRISRVQPGQSDLDQTEVLAAIQKLERDISELRSSSRSTESMETLDRRLMSIEKKVSASDTGLSGRLAASFEILERRLSSIEQRISTPDNDMAGRITSSFESLERRLQSIEQGLSTPDTQLASRMTASVEALERRLQSIEQGLSTPDTELAGRISGSFDTLGNRLNAIEQRLSTPDAELTGRISRSFDTLERRLNSIEQSISTPDPGLLAPIAGSFEALGNRLNSIEQRLSTPDPALASRLAASFEVLERRLQSIEQKVSVSDTELPARLRSGLAALERRLAEGQAHMAETVAKVDPSQNAELLVQNLRMLEGRLSESQQILSRKLEAARSETEVTSTNQMRQLAALQEQQAALAKRLEEVAERAAAPADTDQIERLAEGQQRLLDAANAPRDTEHLDSLAAGLQALEAKVAEGHTALTSKLETVLAEGDENSATQLRYLGTLEELQASVAKRLHALEAVVKNPLDAQQWERLAKGLEFLDVRLVQSLDSVSNKLDTAIASLTSTLDARAAAGQEANLKSAERLWRALRGLEDQITGSYQMVRQSQERLEGATMNVSNALEELRAVHGARSSHTEKLLMEGLENLDGRFAQNLMSISERLNSAIYSLNKSTEEWRSDLANSSEETEERLTARLAQAEAKLSADLKTSLEALGRREERMLALILGGGPALPMPPEVPPKTE